MRVCSLVCISRIAAYEKGSIIRVTHAHNVNTQPFATHKKRFWANSIHVFCMNE